MIDILKISKDAKASKALYKDTINASIGMFYDEKNIIGGIPYINNVLNGLETKEILEYGTLDGGIEYRENIIKWILKSYEKEIREKLYIDSFATIGGSGSIASAFAIYGNTNDFILVSDIRWQYDRFAEKAKLNILEYKLFDGNYFNINDFEYNLNELSKKQKRIIVILNDPCQNPTGYTLTKNEFKDIIKVLNKYKDNEIILFYDAAYIDYDLENSRDKFLLLKDLKEHILTIIGFSASKTFGVYGIRIGGSIAISKSKDKVNHFYTSMLSEARGTWSSVPTVGIKLINEVSKNIDIFNTQFNNVLNTSIERSKAFLESAKKHQLTTYPFKNGFFIMLPSDDPIADYELLKKNRIFVVPVPYGLRIALSSITIDEARVLPEKIKSILTNKL